MDLYKRYSLGLLLFIFSLSVAHTQAIDSLKNVIKRAKDDTNKVNSFSALALELQKANKYEESFLCLNAGIALAEKINYSTGQSELHKIKGDYFKFKNSYSKSLQEYTKALNIDTQDGRNSEIALSHDKLAKLFIEMGDMGVYAIQGARLASGEEPIAVTAQLSTTRPQIYTEVEETAMFQLEFPSGALASCQSSFGINMNYLQANCEKGWFRMEPQSAYNGNKGSSSLGPIEFKIENQQAKQMDEDVEAILNNTNLIAPGEEGLRDIKIVEAIYESARIGKRVLIS